MTITAKTTNLIPQVWAFEAMAQMKKQYTMGSTVTKEYSKDLQVQGDTVHANIPGTLTSARRKDGEDIVPQEVTSTDVPIVLNQLIYTSFIIYAGQASLSGQELFNTFMPGAVEALNSAANGAIMGAVPQFTNYIGGLGEFTNTNAIRRLTAARREAKNFGRMSYLPYMAVTDAVEEEMLNNEVFVQANTSSDNARTQREGYIGTKFNLDIASPYGLPHIDTLDALPYTGAVNNGAGYAVGSTSIVYDNYEGPAPSGSSSSSSSAEDIDYPPAIGSWVSFAGCREPFKVSAGTTSTTLVLDRGLTSAIVDDAVIEFSRSTRTTTEYASGYIHPIEVVDATVLKIGNPISLGGYNYTIMNVSTVTSLVTLDRPLENLVAANSVMGLFPVGSYNLCYRRDAIALVNRPLKAMPNANMYTAIGNDGSITVDTAWDYKKQGTVVTMQMLLGVKVLDTRKGFIMLG